MFKERIPAGSPRAIYLCADTAMLMAARDEDPDRYFTALQKRDAAEKAGGKITLMNPTPRNLFPRKLKRRVSPPIAA